MGISDTDLLAEIQRLADDNSSPPSLSEMQNNGEYSTTTYFNRFGSWKGALERAGFNPRSNARRVEQEDLLQELRRLDQEVDGRPKVRDMDEIGEYSAATYRRQFGSWESALKAAGIKTESPRKITKDELVEELHRLADELGEQPSREQLDEYGRYSADSYRRRFGSWNRALTTAGFESTRVGKTARIREDELIAELQRLSERVGGEPTMKEMDEFGKHSPTTYSNRFGSWSKAVEIALSEENEG
ncbi:hypothetical protein GCM10009037_31130 [Halarchaeum grantii]|uniref:Uncharacterized protein n=1 Tax=Halarchaeum grantii TaxID=1193105 RepID=A0A830FDY1_9EURY|nr:hypothetical protein [Halarchaeum grantii]GGL45449.1 hypothetical protein GCM10009037_31130 [Halarchaeum grantii]